MQAIPTAAVWPEARFIHIVRDGRGVVATGSTLPRDHAATQCTRAGGGRHRGFVGPVGRCADAAGGQLGPGRYLAFATMTRWTTPDDGSTLARTPRRGEPSRLRGCPRGGPASRRLATGSVGIRDRNDRGRAPVAATSPDGAGSQRIRRHQRTAWRTGWLPQRLQQTRPRPVACSRVASGPGHPEAVGWLEDPVHRGSLFGLMNLQPGRDPDHAARPGPSSRPAVCLRSGGCPGRRDAMSAPILLVVVPGDLSPVLATALACILTSTCVTWSQSTGSMRSLDGHTRARVHSDKMPWDTGSTGWMPVAHQLNAVTRGGSVAPSGAATTCARPAGSLAQCPWCGWGRTPRTADAGAG